MATKKKSNDGFRDCNKLMKRAGPLVTPQQLKDVYLFGVTIDDDQGNDIKPEAFQLWIDNAVSYVEHYLDIYISEETVIEYRDFRHNDYMDWGYIQLNNFPLIAVEKLEMVYYRDEDGEPIVVQEIPKSWIRVQEQDGILRLVPNGRFTGGLQVDNLGMYFPEIFKASVIPHAWKITYKAGFEDGKIPALLNQAIALLAACQALIVAGNLVLGVGIQSQNISMDGLSQGIVTTGSAENSTYGANIKEYQRLLYGSTKDDPEGIMNQLQEFYKGYTVGII